MRDAKAAQDAVAGGGAASLAKLRADGERAYVAGKITRDYTTKELMEEKGVKFPDGTTITVLQAKSQVMVRHNAEGHAAVVAVIRGLDL